MTSCTGRASFTARPSWVVAHAPTLQQESASPVAAELLVKQYVEVEKHRHTWSRHHSTEIDRIVELKKL